MTVIHRHHILPRHQGGSDEEDNIAYLTVEQHAEAHRLLYEKYGKEEDRIAWLGLSGIIGREEAVPPAQVLGGKRVSAEKNPWQNKRTSTNWAENTLHHRKALKAAHSEAAKAKRKNTYALNNHQQGETNSAFGTSIYRDEYGNKKRFIRGAAPHGWVLSKDWVEDRKDKSNNTYGKKWFNDGSVNFLLRPNDERVKELKLGRLNPGFKKTA